MIIRFARHGQPALDGMPQGSNHEFPPGDFALSKLGVQQAEFLGKQGICVRAGLHCAPLAHESAGTLRTGTVRISFGHDATAQQTGNLTFALEKNRTQGSQM